MTVRTTNFGGTDWINGTVLTASDLNDTFGYVAPSSIMIGSVYAGSGINSTNNNSSGTTIQQGTYIITLTTADLKGAENLYTIVNYYAAASGGNSGKGYPTLQIDHSVSGSGSYATLFGERTLTNSTDSTAGIGDTNTSIGSFNLALPLSASEKASGVSIKFISRSYAPQGADTATSSFTNIQIFFKGSK